MTNVQRTIVLDGQSNGFACYMYEDKKCLSVNGSQLFSSLQILKTYLTANKIHHTKYKILLYLVINGQQIAVSYNYCMNAGNGKYLLFYNDNTFLIKESVVEEVIGAGYIVTNNGDTEPLISDYKKGMNKYKKIVSKVNSTLKALVLYPDLHLRIARHSWKQFTIGFTDSTTKVVFFDRDLMVRINKERLDAGKNVFPFYKFMDKFTTIYYIITHDKQANTKRDLKLGTDLVDFTIQNLIENYEDMADAKNTKIYIKNEIIL